MCLNQYNEKILEFVNSTAIAEANVPPEMIEKLSKSFALRFTKNPTGFARFEKVSYFFNFYNFIESSGNPRLSKHNLLNDFSSLADDFE